MRSEGGGTCPNSAPAPYRVWVLGNPRSGGGAGQCLLEQLTESLRRVPSPGEVGGGEAAGSPECMAAGPTLATPAAPGSIACMSISAFVQWECAGPCDPAGLRREESLPSAEAGAAVATPLCVTVVTTEQPKEGIVFGSTAMRHLLRTYHTSGSPVTPSRATPTAEGPRRSPDLIIVIGGDGTLSEVIHGLCSEISVYRASALDGAETRQGPYAATESGRRFMAYARERQLFDQLLPNIMYLPAGTGADFARLGICCKTVAECAQAVAQLSAMHWRRSYAPKGVRSAPGSERPTLAAGAQSARVADRESLSSIKPHASPLGGSLRRLWMMKNAALSKLYAVQPLGRVPERPSQASWGAVDGSEERLCGPASQSSTKLLPHRYTCKPVSSMCGRASACGRRLRGAALGSASRMLCLLSWVAAVLAAFASTCCALVRAGSASCSAESASISLEWHSVDVGRATFPRSGRCYFFINECSMGLSSDVVRRAEDWIKHVKVISMFGGRPVFALSGLIGLIVVRPHPLRVMRLPALAQLPLHSSMTAGEASWDENMALLHEARYYEYALNPFYASGSPPSRGPRRCVACVRTQDPATIQRHLHLIRDESSSESGGSAAAVVPLCEPPAQHASCTSRPTWVHFSSSMLAFCNGRWFGGGMNVSPIASPTDGAISVTSWRMTFWFVVLLRFISLYSGGHVDWAGRTTLFEGDRYVVDVDFEHDERRGRANSGTAPPSELSGRTPHEPDAIHAAVTFAEPEGGRPGTANAYYCEADGEILEALPAVIELAGKIVFVAPATSGLARAECAEATRAGLRRRLLQQPSALATTTRPARAIDSAQRALPTTIHVHEPPPVY